MAHDRGPIRVHALADRTLQVNVRDSGHLAPGDELTGTPVVKIVRDNTDVSAALLAGTPEAAGDFVRFRKKADAAAEQAEGAYIGKITCGTLDGDTVVATFDLVITRKGVVTAE